MTPGSTEFWLGVMTVAGVNLALSGDNAVVIALVARSLPSVHQKRAITFGVAVAIVLRIALILFAVRILMLPYLKLVGAALLFWIAARFSTSVRRLDGAVTKAGDLGAGIRTILIADLVMSLDNVLAVAAAAHGSLPTLALGLAASIPVLA
jgi:YjbE family integral membrane protein